jgi:DNA-binding MarR family transcriptional regulator
MKMTERGYLETRGESPAGSFDEFVGAVLDLLRAARRTGASAHAIGRDGVSLPQVAVLGAVDDTGERGVSAVADRAGLAQPTVTRALTALERRGMVRRAPHASDGRSTSLSLTARGRAVLDEKRREIMGRFAELWSTLAPDERSHAVTLVRRLSGIAADLA